MTEPSAREVADYGRRMSAALSGMWREIQHRHVDVPDATVIAVNRTPRGRRPAAEVFVPGPVIAEGGRAVLAVELHAAAHTLAVVRGIGDTSSAGNRYHNRRFVQMAEELGMRGPARPAPVTGWADVTVTGDTAAAYAAAIKALNGARRPYLPMIASQADSSQTRHPPARDGGRLALTCQCEPARRLHLTFRQIEDGPVLCGNCQAEFTKASPAKPQPELACTC